jgi:transcriptional regulator with XRE-family HTH domain
MMSFGHKVRQKRIEQNLTQDEVRKVLGYETRSYVSDVEAGRFIPTPDKLAKYARALGMTKEEMDDLVLEEKLEKLGLDDPAFTVMFKEIPHMTKDEKQSLIRAYESVIRARQTQQAKRARGKT